MALAQNILAEAKGYLKPSTETYCALISVCGAAGQPELGESYLLEVDEPDEFTFNAAIGGWASRGKVKKAREVFERMKGMGSAVQPSTVRPPLLICDRKSIGRMLMMMMMMPNRGGDSSSRHNVTILDDLCHSL